MRALVGTGLCFVLLSTTVYANLIMDGGFEQSPYGSPGIVYAGSTFGDWSVGDTGQGLSRVYIWWAYQTAPEGNVFLQLHSLGGGADLSQVVDVQPGGRYELSFQVGNSDPDGNLVKLEVFSKYPVNTLVETHSLANIPVSAIGGSGNNHWVAQSITFTATVQQERLFFRNTVGSVVLDNIKLTEISPGYIPGDFNRDGVVDAGDYVVWRDGLGHVVSPCSGGDSNCNGFVEWEDYGSWRENFGRTSNGNVGAAASIPEPANFSLLTAAIATAGRLRVRRKVGHSNGC